MEGEGGRSEKSRRPVGDPPYHPRLDKSVNPHYSYYPHPPPPPTHYYHPGREYDIYPPPVSYAPQYDYRLQHYAPPPYHHHPQYAQPHQPIVSSSGGDSPDKKKGKKDKKKGKKGTKLSSKRDVMSSSGGDSPDKKKGKKRTKLSSKSTPDVMSSSGGDSPDKNKGKKRTKLSSKSAPDVSSSSESPDKKQQLSSSNEPKKSRGRPKKITEDGFSKGLSNDDLLKDYTKPNVTLALTTCHFLFGTQLAAIKPPEFCEIRAIVLTKTSNQFVDTTGLVGIPVFDDGPMWQEEWYTQQHPNVTFHNIAKDLLVSSDKILLIANYSTVIKLIKGVVTNIVTALASQEKEKLCVITAIPQEMKNHEDVIQDLERLTHAGYRHRDFNDFIGMKGKFDWEEIMKWIFSV